jgi:pilus assembly protein CpaE
MMGGALIPSVRSAAAIDEFLAFANDETSLEVVQQLVRDQGWPMTAARLGGLDMARVAVQESGAPRFLLVDIDGADDPVSALAGLVELCGAGCAVIAIGGANDIELYRRLIGAGARDYLAKPIDLPQLSHCVLAAANAGPMGAEPGRGGDGEITFFVGTRGGCGASTAAVNVAWMLAHEHKLKTVLLDLDLHFGIAALALDLEPGRGLREALESPSRLDSLLIASSLVNESERLCVLAAEEPLEDTVSFEAPALTALISELRRSFDAVVVDFPRALIPSHRRVFTMAGKVVLVCEISLAGIRDHVRAFSAVRSIGEPGFLNVAARVGKNRPAQIDRPAFERGIEAKLDALVPEDPKALAMAANQGRALASVAAGSPATKALRQLADTIGPAQERRRFARGGLLGRIGLASASR